MKKKYSMQLKPIWDEVENVRNQCCDYLESQGKSQDTVDAVSMITSELVENAVKYGDFPSPNDRIKVNLEINNKIIIEVLSPILAEKKMELKRLDRTIQWIRGHQNPFEAFVEKLKMVSARPLENSDSGLGLFRIAFEGQAVLDFCVSDDGVISVSAIYIPE